MALNPASAQGTDNNAKGEQFTQLIRTHFHNQGFQVRDSGMRTHWEGVDGKAITLGIWVYACKAYPLGLAVNANRIESSGSGADKFFRDAWNVFLRYESPCIFVVDGENRDVTPARDFLRSLVGQDPFGNGRMKSLLGVFDYVEFVEWIATQSPTREFYSADDIVPVSKVKPVGATNINDSRYSQTSLF